MKKKVVNEKADKTILYAKYIEEANNLRTKYIKLGISSIEILGIEELDKTMRVVKADRIIRQNEFNLKIEEVFKDIIDKNKKIKKVENDR